MKKFLVMALAVVMHQAVATDVSGVCKNSQLLGAKLITDICWKCVTPIRVAGITLSKGFGGSDDGLSLFGTGEEIPSAATSKTTCLCHDNPAVPSPGIVTSFWEPFRLIEWETTPGCLSVLNGTKVNVNRNMRGRHGSGNRKRYETSVMHYHYYSFPLVQMLNLFAGKGCNPGGYGDLDLMNLSEIDPTWYDAELGAFMNPEALLFANPASIAACVADSVAAVANNPIDAMFWCAGTWGLVYPITGHVSDDYGLLKATSLTTVRVLTALHRRGSAWKSLGDGALCNGEIAPYLTKSQYKFTMAWPVADTRKSHKLGALVEGWGPGKIIPAAGEDPIYLIWRWLDCCNRF